MKTSYFRRLALLLALFIPLVLQAQQPPQPCKIVITGDFESQCVLPSDKDSFYVENGDALIACKGMRVTYTATVNTGGSAVSGWSWSVIGAATWNDLGNGSVTVDWDNGSFGQLSVAVTTAAGATCEKTVNVLLIERPTIASASTPAYVEYPDGSKTLYVCKDESVDFTDLSTTTNTDIAGYYWESTQGGSASTPNYHVESFANYDDVVHRVYNNCGCYSEEVIHIEILYGDTLDLGCYGTVCEGTTVTYTANNPICGNYYWYVEGGTILDGQDSPQVTVQWGSPADGYGVVGLDGDLCGHACPAMLSKKIPVISDHLAIKGQHTACVGESVVYSLPLFGSTRYRWTVTPAYGAVSTSVNGANEWMYTFTQPGTYHISVAYGCDFLECGEFETEPFTVVVKPKLAITGEERICKSNACQLATDPGVSANWKVQYIDNNYQQVYTASGSTLSTTFQNPGKYLVTATNSNYCQPARFILTVEDTPPAPISDDLDPDNPTIACLNSAIQLNGNPTNPDYTLIWEPACAQGSPSSVSGNEVTISYGSAVCDVNVYNYDRVLGCRSTSHYTHPVSQFQLAQHTLPTQITVCPGTPIDWRDRVPYQDNVVYEWRLQDFRQYCASVQGSRFSNAIQLQVNELVPPYGYPKTFTVTLYRTYCSSIQDTHIVSITIDTIPPTSALSISDPGPICVGTTVQLTGQGCGNGSSLWRIQGDGQTYTDNPLDYTFTTPGNTTVTYLCNTYDVCSNPSYIPSTTRSVSVFPLPSVEGIGYDGTNVFIYPVPQNPSAYTYQWSHINNSSSYIVPADPNVTTYSCTVTSQSSPYCSVSLSVNTDTISQVVSTCQNLTVVSNGIDYCTKTIGFQVNNPPGQVEWTILGGNHGAPTITGNNDEYITFPVSQLGDYRVKAFVQGTPCYLGTAVQSVEFLHDFTFEKRCDTIVIHNHSKYLDANKTLKLYVNNALLLNGTVGFTECRYYTGNGGTFVFSLGEYNGNTINCPLETVTISNTAGFPLSLTPANPTTCDNTPIELTLSTTPPTVLPSVHWSFGDGSCLDATGNSVFHTFGLHNLFNSGWFHVTAESKDDNGCTSTASVNLVPHADNLLNSSLSPTSNTVVCPGTARELLFSGNGGILYDWRAPLSPAWNSSTNNAYQTGDYSVFVRDNNYCQAEAYCNVKFLNQPEAVIIASSPTYCVGDEIKLYGAPDPDTTHYTFSWTITELPSNTVTTSSYSKVTMTPTQAVTAYNVQLCVTNGEPCTACDQKTIQVQPVPTAPTIVYGTNPCIDNPPVNLVGSSLVTSDLHWSNGNIGTHADYYTPGIATAWYYDPVTGCKSADANIFIEPEPNFDALLTGCYKRCKSFLEDHDALPVWGLYAGREPIDWYWWYNNNFIDNNVQTAPNYFLRLPIVGSGDYWLDVKYNSSNCIVSSPHLTVEIADTCECEDLDVSSLVDWDLKECKIVYSITVTICNNSDDDACINKLIPLFDVHDYDIVSNTFYPQTLASGHCYTFYMTIEVAQILSWSSLSFRILDECNNCTTDFSIDLAQFDNQCEDTMSVQNLAIPPGMVSDAAAYFDFSVNLSFVQRVLAFWVDPPTLLNYTISSMNMVHGLYMIDRGVLSQLALEGREICFHAITCWDDKLCHRIDCISAATLYQLLPGRSEPSGPVNDTVGDSVREQMAPLQMMDESPVRLVPNPAMGEVQVTGAAGRVVEVLVLDLKGRQVALFENSDRFDVSTLPSGVYIVRVTTRHGGSTGALIEEETTYLKLVKE